MGHNIKISNRCDFLRKAILEAGLITTESSGLSVSRYKVDNANIK